MTTTKNQLTLLIMKFMDYLIQESGYYVTEKATIRTSDRREQGYRKQTRSTGDTRLKAIFWGFQLIQVSRDEMQNYAERYTLKHENDSEKLKKTDYTDILLKYIDEFIEADGIGKDNSNHIHREICNHYREKIPKDKQYFLGHFSLKRGPNVYGLIFGTGHLLGMEKFVRACWKKDSLRGEANYDIDSDCINPNAPSIFADMNKPSRLQHFEAELENLILDEKLITNKDIYVFTVTNGILPRIARDKLKAMISTGLLPGQKVLVSWDAYKSKLSKRIELN